MQPESVSCGRDPTGMVEDDALRQWFRESVLPYEPALVRFIARNCRDEAEVIDIRQQVYERALRSAGEALPISARHYLFTIARNLLIDRARRAKIVSFERVADLETLGWDGDLMATERQIEARDELRRAMAGLDKLPARCREVVRLRKVEGLSVQETADRLGVGHHTIERQLTLGIRALSDFMLGGDGRIRRSGKKARGKEASR